MAAGMFRLLFWFLNHVSNILMFCFDLLCIQIVLFVCFTLLRGLCRWYFACEVPFGHGMISLEEWWVISSYFFVLVS